MKFMRTLILALTFLGAAALAPLAADQAMPRYQHVFVIMDENKDYGEILDPARAPHISALAKTYGNATSFFAETHPSEPNYVALVGGDTFGIADDGYHTVDAPNLAAQLERAGLSWKGYYQSIPAPGSAAAFGGLYAFKHSGFMTFDSVRNDPQRAAHIVGFDRLDRDLVSDELPSFGFIVPNLCEDMHGAPGCTGTSALIRRGDATIGELVQKIQATRAWNSADNVAIVITFDEDDDGSRSGCCAAPRGGGHIPTIVVTNHGPRGISDGTPYNHYSLLRTIEDALGLSSYLGHAAQSGQGVRPMLPLFATPK